MQVHFTTDLAIGRQVLGLHILDADPLLFRSTQHFFKRTAGYRPVRARLVVDPRCDVETRLLVHREQRALQEEGVTLRVLGDRRISIGQYAEQHVAPNLRFVFVFEGQICGKPTPSRVLVAFEDPRCGFCKKLHQDLQGVKDLMVYTFPVAFLGPQSREMNEGIWCANDRAQAWKAVMTGQGAPVSKGCDFAALDRNMEVARKLRVTGTPTMFTASGQRIVGAVGLDAIEQALRASN